MVTVATIRSRRPRDFDLDQGGGHCGAELPVRSRMRVTAHSIAALIEIKAPIAGAGYWIWPDFVLPSALAEPRGEQDCPVR
jgi:hypothetical protein